LAAGLPEPLGRKSGGSDERQFDEHIDPKPASIRHQQSRMQPRRYKNLVPDSPLHRELEKLLRESDGRASLEAICEQVTGWGHDRR
jgi:hypothetical protein